eukprot:SAG31_NODE_17936_length_652_cov_1.401447_1_plen_26_part_01
MALPIYATFNQQEELHEAGEYGAMLR